MKAAVAELCMGTGLEDRYCRMSLNSLAIIESFAAHLTPSVMADFRPQAILPCG